MCQEKDVQSTVACSCQATAGTGFTQPTAAEPAPTKAMYAGRRRVRLVKGLPTKQLFQTLHHHARHGGVSQRALGFYLDDLEVRGEYKEPGYASATQLAEAILGVSQREARTLIKVSRALEELPELDRAFANDEIGWSKLREIALVAVPETELEWLAFAKEHNCRQVEAAVSQKGRGHKPSGPNDLGTPRMTASDGAFPVATAY